QLWQVRLTPHSGFDTSSLLKNFVKSGPFATLARACQKQISRPGAGPRPAAGDWLPPVRPC
ncbi:MAG: hypothetical protein AB7F22_36400, partial [Reyranella sp.]|uniref:hypothetical protein n=1 Tax=Reyranella sp. TaxID=1929291 RepID=UPI003D1356C8